VNGRPCRLTESGPAERVSRFQRSLPANEQFDDIEMSADDGQVQPGVPADPRSADIGAGDRLGPPAIVAGLSLLD
jgi:hypothetical protein